MRRWTTQYHVAIADTAALPEVLQLIEWLEGHIPAGDKSPSQPAVVHGDYRLDNLVYDPKVGWLVHSCAAGVASQACREPPKISRA